MPYIDLSDARLFYDSAGSAGTPVLLLMGFGAPGSLWRTQIDALSPNHRVAWFDNCGVGATRAARRRPPTMRDFARHAFSVMDDLAWPDAHIVGVSMGGMIAQEMALAARARARSLTLLVTHAGGLRNLIPTGRGLSLFVRGFLGPRKHRARAIERLVYPEHYLDQIDRDRLHRVLRDEVVEAGGVRDRLRQVAAVMSHRTARRLGSLEGLPTLVVKAGRDVLVRPGACHRLHELIPGSRLIEFEESGHAVLHQCAPELNRALLEHFREADCFA